MKTKLFPLYLGFWLIYFAIVWSQALRVATDGWYAAYLPHWADGAAHLSYMANFAYRPTFPSEHPLFLDHPYSYSFAADYLGGLMVRAGISLPGSYNLLGFFLSLAAVIGIWQLFFSILKSPLQTLIASSLFFFSGGLGWRYYLNNTPINQENYFFALFTQIKATPIVWLNTIVGELIPQRSFLLGLPIGCFLLWLFIRRFIFNLPTSRWLLLGSGIGLGLLPIIHPHTAFIVATAVVCYGITNLFNTPSSRRQTLIDLAVIGFPAGCLGYFLASRFIFSTISSGFFRFFPGWLASTTNTNWLLFWLDNWGIFLPLAVIGTFYSPRKIQLLLLPFWLWFIGANLFLFQPYDWDNSKLFTWIYLAFTLPVVNCLEHWRRRGWSKGVLILALLLLTFSGAVDAFRMLDTRTQSLKLLDTTEITLANYLRQHSLPTSIVLTSTTHRNWVAIAAGRQILCGYRGWMWTYGIDDAARYNDLKAIYRGGAEAGRLISHYGIDYIVVGPEEKNEFMIDPIYFAHRYPVFYQTATTTIYQVNQQPEL